MGISGGHTPGQDGHTTDHNLIDAALAAQATALASKLDAGTLLSTYSRIPAATDSGTVYVSVNGNDAYDGLSWKAAKLTLASAAVALPSVGGVIQLGPGDFATGNTAVTISKRVSIRGMGRDVTRIMDSGTANDGIILNADFCTVQDLSLYRSTATGSVTGGAGIKLATGRYAAIERCVIGGWQDNIQIVSAAGWTIRGNYIVTPTRYGIFVQDIGDVDNGDQVIEGNVFDTSIATPAAVRQESGGGLKIVGNKFLHHVYSFDMQIADGAATSVLTIVGNSMEVASTSLIRLGRLGTTGTFHNTAITGNHFNAIASALVHNAGSSSVAYVGNSLYLQSATVFGVIVNGGGRINIEANDIDTVSAAKCIQLNSSASQVQVGLNRYPSLSGSVTIEDNIPFNVGSPGVLVHHYRRSIAGLTSTSSYQNYIQFDLSNYRALTVVLTFELLLGGVGGVAREVKGILSRGTSGVTFTSIQDTAVGAAIDIQFDVATTVGSAILGIRRNAAAGGTQLDGNITIKADGHAQRTTVL